ncbi:MAG: YkgJ family cysteine cluster protein, partial [Betaproteobacteria bacterium]|nr:YkgJ family cysteine cluster protein [Betaproteobacteria bacterium]
MATASGFDCSKCPGYCCTYPRIVISLKDLTRIARHFEISEDEARRQFTKPYKDQGMDEIVLKHQRDSIYASVCRFFDTAARRCTIYKARPKVCRNYPHGKRCGYYEFLQFERDQQDDQHAERCDGRGLQERLYALVETRA